MRPQARRKSDGALFEASYRRDADFFEELMGRRAIWYFRGVVRNPWWMFWKRWSYTGEVWMPDAGEFDVL